MTDKSVEKGLLPLSQLRRMEIIDIHEGKRLGFISDITFNDDLTRADSLVIPPEGGLFTLFKKKDEIQIKWHQIKVIGVDIILVDLSAREASQEKPEI
jgi:YlmC/YmxH family sporulation protein